jgi:hypothetical protein
MQLGLGACSFRLMTGKPCPSCGMTTAFAWAARGRFGNAWRANPAGSLIAPSLFVAVPWLMFASITGRSRPFRSFEAPLLALVLGGVGLTLLAWALRISGLLA